MSSASTLREVFERVKAHMLAQRKAAKVSVPKTWAEGTETRCCYRTDDGLKCAVGCLITDEAYHDGLEGNYSLAPVVIDALRASGVDVSDMRMRAMLHDLQNVHDGMDPSVWASELDDVEARYHLPAAT